MRKLIIIFCVLMSLVGCNSENVIHINRKNQPSEMKIHYIDIKNGRCAFLELPNGECLLVDSGATTDFPVIYEYLRKLEVKNIDYMIISANDKYHLGGAIKLMNNFKVHEIFVSKSIPDESLYKNMADEAIRYNSRIHIAEGGTEIFTHDNLNIAVVSPVHENYNDYEDFSLSTIVTYGNINYLLMANITEKSEKDMVVTSGKYLKSTILSSPCNKANILSTAFLQNVSPEYAVIQVFDKKTPNKSIINTLEILGVHVLRTDVNGNIVITGNSESITNIRTER